MTGLGEGKASALSTNYTSPEDVSLSTRAFFKKKKNPNFLQLEGKHSSARHAAAQRGFMAQKGRKSNS